MSRARLRVCGHPGCATMTGQPLCPEHQASRDRHQRMTTPTKRAEPLERRRRAEAVRAHRAEHGDWCPGWRRPPHPAADLTADDTTPISHTGAPSARLRILCRSCNSRRGAHTLAALRRGDPPPE